MTTTVYHINRAGKKAVCKATKIACQFSAASHTTEVSEVTDTETLLKKMDSFTSVAVDEATNSHAFHPMNEVSFPQPFVSSTWAKLAFEFTDDDPYYGPEAYSELSQDVHQVDVKELLHGIHQYSEIPDEYVAYAEKNDWGNPDNFEVQRTWGYYEEIEVDVSLKPEFMAKVEAYYYSSPVATDSNGVLAYARGKGLDTTGKTPVEALKALLKQENGGRDHPRVDNADTVESKSLQLKNIRIPSQKHYDAVEPRKLQPGKGSSPIAGVVVRENGVDSLVDGYHRTKHLNGKLRKSATYFVLSNTSKP